MVIKKYLVDDMKEAMEKISDELGPDATIVSSRKVKKGGFLGLFKNVRLEVIAAYDNFDYHRQMTDKAFSTTMSYNKTLLEQVNELKDIVTNLQSSKMDQLNNLNSGRILSDVEMKIDKLLDDLNFTKAVKSRFKDFVEVNGLEASQINEGAIYQFTKKEIEAHAKTNPFLTKKINFVVGPTGVGKTTTIAKLVSNEIIKNRNKVALITLDTYRIAAAEQLKVYASILDIPLQVCYSPKDFKEALKMFEDYDYIFVDTTGRSSMNIENLQNYFNLSEDITVFLAFTPTVKFSDMAQILKNYKAYNYDRLILTKLDESRIHENILNLMYYSKTPISHLCFGQKVPNDIETANKENLVKFAWPKVKNERPS